MKIQEEIRQGLAGYLISQYEGDPLERLAEHTKTVWLEEAKGILEYLHSKGVVIQTGEDKWENPCGMYQMPIIEPLIEENNENTTTK